jgi:hypothetical protein
VRDAEPGRSQDRDETSRYETPLRQAREWCQTARSAPLKMTEVLTRSDADLRYRAVERIVGIDELDAALRAAIEEVGRSRSSTGR